ncbi:MAG: hypothetical protein V3R54_02840 [Thermodesulfovibrionia bacterium]
MKNELPQYVIPRLDRGIQVSFKLSIQNLDTPVNLPVKPEEEYDGFPPVGEGLHGKLLCNLKEFIILSSLRRICRGEYYKICNFYVSILFKISGGR